MHPGTPLVVILLSAAVVGAIAAGSGIDAAAAKTPPRDAAAAPLAQATRLQARWGHCDGRATAVATRQLARAKATRAPRPRLTRARTAVRTWHAVARACMDSGTGAPITVGRGAYLPESPAPQTGRRSG